MSGKQHRVEKTTSLLELRIGGVHLTVQRVPYFVLALLSGFAGSMGGALWLGR
ncbi:hypothetical protein ACWC24_36805 [Streptomyces sp. NPDC001443]